MCFGERIKRHRIELGMTQKQFAERLCISQNTVSQYEKGVRNPSIRLIKKLSSELGISIETLLQESDGISE